MQKNRFLVFITVVIAVCFVAGEVHAALPNDPEVEQWAFKDIQAYDVWEKSLDASHVVVAIIDNGFDTFHPDLAGNVWKNLDEIPGNNIDDDKNGYVDDVWGWDFVGEGDNDPRPGVSKLTAEDKHLKIFHHGTVVAGIIGARKNNKLAGAGIAPKIKLMNLRLLDENGNGGFDYLDDAIRYAVDNGAGVINLSMVGNGTTHDLDQSIDYAYRNNVAVVAAAGNNSIFLNNSNRYPVCLDIDSTKQKVLGVSGIEESHRLASFSTQGSNYGSDCIDIAAPGKNISSILRYAPRFGLKEVYGNGWDGTSFAAPFVSAAVALVKSIQPTWTVEELYTAVLSTVHKTPPGDEEAYAHLFGHGLLQIDNAVEYALALAPKSKAVTDITAISFDTGRKSTWNMQKKKKTEAYDDNQFFIKNINNIASLTDTEYVATRFDARKKETTILFYSADWKKQKQWSVPSTSPLDIAVENILGDDTKEIILYSPSNSKNIQLFSVYDQAGNMVLEKKLDKQHEGVSLTTIKNTSSDTEDILVAYTVDNNIIISRYNALGEKIGDNVAVTSISSVGALAAGDIDGDGVAEYVLTTAAGDDPWMVYYEPTGVLKRKFSAYTFSYKNGFDLAVTDYDADGKDDVITAPYNSVAPIRVWSGKAKKIAGWYAFESRSLEALKLIVH
jgi:hypothetical protein